MRGCILSLFHKEFNKFNNTGARILDSVYHMTYYHIQITSKSQFWRENKDFAISMQL